MLINGGRALKNGAGGAMRIFKSQGVDSYVQNNTPDYNYVYLGLSGLSENSPFNIYYQTPFGTTKYSYAIDSTYSPYFAATNEGSFKPYLFSGNLGALYSVGFYNTQYWNGYYMQGDFIKFVEQFPNLESLMLNQSGNYYYNYTQFNQNISNFSFPRKIWKLSICDSTLSGNINTFKNFSKIQELTLAKSQFTGNFTNIYFENLKNLILGELYNLNGNLLNIINDNPNLEYLSISNCNLFGGDASASDVSGIKYIFLDIQNCYQLTGDITGWNFNTGLTSFQLRNQYLSANMTNWNFSNTLCQTIEINNYYYGNTNGKLYGSLSGWTMPSTLQSMNFNGVSGLTSVPLDYSGCPLFSTLYVLDCRDVEQNINDFVFDDYCSFIYFHNYSPGKLYGDIGSLVMPTGTSFLGLNYNRITGDIATINMTPNMQNLYLSNNLLHGELNGMTFPNSLMSFQVNGNSGITLNLNLGVFNLNQITSFYANNISGITGSFANLTHSNPYLSEFRIDYTPVHSDLSELDITGIHNLYTQQCGTGMTGNLTNWLTGATSMDLINIGWNPNLSGDTSGWNLNNAYYIYLNNTKLSGTFTHNNVYYLNIADTEIDSNIETDFNLSNRAYWVEFNRSKVTGDLGNISLYMGQYVFYVYGCTGVTGSNQFIDYIFDNKVNFTNYYFIVDIRNIGDSVTGATETSGSTGTWTGNIMDLTEAGVNNLAAGLDWDGAGSNTPWDSKQKIWWLLYSTISSTNPIHRYTSNFQINYEGY